MKLYPFRDCIAGAEVRIRKGGDVFQQFNCSSCGTKQTMPDRNIFYKTGRCEECGKITDIEQDGCNYMLVV
jgi:RNase P subunit RPR2